MTHTFPDDFIFGTSTSSSQIETAFDHDWLNLRSRDGNIFNRTTDHEIRMREDAEIIASLAPPETTLSPVHINRTVSSERLKKIDSTPFSKVKTYAI